MNVITREPNQQIVSLVEENNSRNRIQVDSIFPNVVLTRYNAMGQRENFHTHSVLTNRRVVVITVPGAFTPTCTNNHLASYKNDVDTILNGLNVDEVICIAPDKVDVVRAWGLAHGHQKITMWADNECELTLKLGLGLNMSGNRAQGMGMMRTAFIVNNRKVEWLGIDQNPAECKLSRADEVINYLQKARSGV